MNYQPSSHNIPEGGVCVLHVSEFNFFPLSKIIPPDATQYFTAFIIILSWLLLRLSNSPTFFQRIFFFKGSSDRLYSSPRHLAASIRMCKVLSNAPSISKKTPNITTFFPLLLLYVQLYSTEQFQWTSLVVRKTGN